MKQFDIKYETVEKENQKIFVAKLVEFEFESTFKYGNNKEFIIQSITNSFDLLMVIYLKFDPEIFVLILKFFLFILLLGTKQKILVI